MFLLPFFAILTGPVPVLVVLALWKHVGDAAHRPWFDVNRQSLCVALGVEVLFLGMAGTLAVVRPSVAANVTGVVVVAAVLGQFLRFFAIYLGYRTWLLATRSEPARQADLRLDDGLHR